MGVTGNWDRRLSRRTFIGLGGMSAAALMLNPGRASAQAGYGDTVPDPGGVIDLPQDFQYRIISPEGSQLSDGGGFTVFEEASASQQTLGSDLDALEAYVGGRSFGIPADFGQRIVKQG